MNWINETIKTVDRHSNQTKKQQQFGVIILLLLLLVFGVSIYKIGLIFNSKQLITGIGSILILIVIAFIPRLLYSFLFVWLFLGNVLGEISSFIILGIVYYLMFCPITFIQNIFSKIKQTNGWIDKGETINYDKLY